jgi:hypothetical protein
VQFAVVFISLFGGLGICTGVYGPVKVELLNHVILAIANHEFDS